MPGKEILVCNCGSSSVKVDIFDFARSNKPLVSADAGRVGTENTTIRVSGREIHIEGKQDHRQAFIEICENLEAEGFFRPESRFAIGHRVVHGGSGFDKPVLIDSAVKEGIQKCIKFAPLHNPANLAGIEAASERYSVPQVAVFDTAFHANIPDYAYTYAIPSDLTDKYEIRKFGFHGPSHQYITERAAALLNKPVDETSLISLHLGNGASLCAVRNGRSVDTSMGFTPLEGLVMGTRCGDLDPAIVTFLMQSENMSPQELDRLLNKESGLKGITETNDMRDIAKRAEEGDRSAQLAIGVFVHRIRRYLGAYLAELADVNNGKGPDAVVFTAGIGENSALIRSRVLKGLTSLGIETDESLNENPDGDEVQISKDSSKIKVFKIATDEEWMIAKSTEIVAAESG